MRILHVNKYLYRRGGAEGYMEDVAALQAQAGHRVGFFGMDDPENGPFEFDDRFPPHLLLDPPPASLVGRVKAVGRMLYSKSARDGMKAVVDELQPDVAHLHNIYYHLSPSILAPLRDAGVSVVMTLHDYKLACPTYQFLDHGKVCEACLGGKFHNAVLRRCNEGSIAASAVSAGELFLHTVTGAYAPVDRFVCPSRFMAGKMAEAGVFPDRLRWIPHFIDTTPMAVKQTPGGDVLYAGRLSHEKGVDVLIEAVGRSGVQLDIAGDGPTRLALEALAERVAPGQVRFHGRLNKAALHDLIRSSAVLVMPSRWYENQPMIVLEAFACGVPVIGTNLGGTPELIEPGVDGAIVPANDSEALGVALAQMLADPQAAFAMGQAARAKVETRFAPDVHLRNLDELYAEAAATMTIIPSSAGRA